MKSKTFKKSANFSELGLFSREMTRQNLFINEKTFTTKSFVGNEI